MSHLTVAASQRVVTELFEAVRDGFTFEGTNHGSFGPFTAGYDIAIRLAGGELDLRSDGQISIRELDVRWERLELSLGIDIPEICIGGFCILPDPFSDGCLIRAPEICVFSASPDIDLRLPIEELVTTELSVRAAPSVKYKVDPGRQPWMTDWDARDANVSNKWQLFLAPSAVDLDLFDVSDIVGDLLDRAVEALVDDLLGGLPDWARTILRGVLGSVAGFVRTLLEIPDDIGEWLSNLLGTSLGLFNAVLGAVGDYLGARVPLYEHDDPQKILDREPGKMEVLIPVANLAARVTDQELILTADVGPQPPLETARAEVAVPAPKVAVSA